GRSSGRSEDAVARPLSLSPLAPPPPLRGRVGVGGDAGHGASVTVSIAPPPPRPAPVEGAGEQGESGEAIARYFFSAATSFRQLWFSRKPSTSRALRFESGASSPSSLRRIGVFGQWRARNSAVGISAVIVSLTALKTWNPSPSFCRQR